MKQLHHKPGNQQRWNDTSIELCGIGMSRSEGDTNVLFTRNSEYIHKRPEGIRMQEQ